MNARHVAILCCVTALLGSGCKGRARFKPRASSSFSSSRSAAEFRPPRSFDVDDFTSRAGDDEVERMVLRELERERQTAKAEVKGALEETVERRCASTSKPRYLEPQGAGLQSVFRAMRRVNAPSDVSVPAATTVMGLPVQVMALDGEDSRWCVDGDDALVRVVAAVSAPAREALVQVAPGAWLVLTKPGAVPASSALVSPSFLSSLGGTGSLVAFAPTDHAIAFADASKPEAIRQAAKMLWGHVDVTGAAGVLQSQPLMLTKGEWRAWAPKSQVAEVVRLRTLTEELETKMGADITADLIETSEALSLIGAGLPPFDLGQGVATTRLVDEKRRVRVTVELDSEDAQIVGRADVVRLSAASGKEVEAGWSAFSSTAGSRLTPVKVDGVVVPNVFRLAPSFSWPKTL